MKYVTLGLILYYSITGAFWAPLSLSVIVAALAFIFGITTVSHMVTGEHPAPNMAEKSFFEIGLHNIIYIATICIIYFEGFYFIAGAGALWIGVVFFTNLLIRL